MLTREGKRICDECGRPSADYGEFLNGAYGPVPKGALSGTGFPPEGYCGRDNQAQDYYDNGQCEDCATYPLKRRIVELEERIAKLEALDQ
jgi:hypothetical protein